MPSVACQCGATFRFAEAHIGKKARCKKCGTTLVLAGEQEGPIALANEPNLDDVIASAVAKGKATSPKQGGLHTKEKHQPKSFGKSLLKKLNTRRNKAVLVFIVGTALISLEAYLQYQSQIEVRERLQELSDETFPSAIRGEIIETTQGGDSSGRRRFSFVVQTPNGSEWEYSFKGGTAVPMAEIFHKGKLVESLPAKEEDFTRQYGLDDFAKGMYGNRFRIRRIKGPRW